MAHKTFISYKYSEARQLRDRIIESLGSDATYYKGETSDSPDLTDRKTETIKKNLRDMIFDTSITIVIISKEMRFSEWIDWEIEYSLKATSRDGRTSHTNGIVGVIMNYPYYTNDPCGWFRYDPGCTRCNNYEYHESYLFDIIKNNRRNQVPPVDYCRCCHRFKEAYGSYISFVDEDTFLLNPDKYIEIAFEKSQNDAYGYDLCKDRHKHSFHLNY